MSSNEQQTIDTQSQIKFLALQVGFDACGVSRAEKLIEQEEPLHSWINNDYQGEMGYMERNIDKRIDPRSLVPDAKSIISVLLNYYPGNLLISTTPPKISRYALNRDYHTVIKGMLHQLLDLIRKEFGKVEGRPFVDSAPVLERAWAQKAGIGWIGKNTMLIHPKIGSYTFIGELVVDMDIEPTTSTFNNKCGTCTRCIDACPTGAIVSPMIIDSRKCISYLTIEKKTALTEEEQKSLNGWCFGCDTCQEVCPWNSKTPISNAKELIPRQDILSLSSSDIKSITKEKFENIFGDTPISRVSFDKFIVSGL